jgi:hypothetical protein
MAQLVASITTVAVANRGDDGVDYDHPNLEALFQQLHVPNFVSLPLSQLDPSLAIGFYFASREAFDAFCRNYRYQDTKQTAWRRLLSIQHTAPSYVYEDKDEGPLPGWMQAFFEEEGKEGHNFNQQKTASIVGKHVHDSDDDDDYVILYK